MKSSNSFLPRSRRFPAFRRAAILLLLALVAAPLLADELSGSRAKKVLKEAAEAARTGNSIKARELYQLVAAGTLKTPARRADALYGLALVEAGRPAAERDAALLESTTAAFLKEFSKDERKPAIAALSGLLAEGKGIAGQIAALEARLAAAEAELAQKEQAAASAGKDSSKKVEELEAKLRRQTAEMEILKGELAKKEEALKKLKKVVVGGG